MTVYILECTHKKKREFENYLTYACLDYKTLTFVDCLHVYISSKQANTAALSFSFCILYYYDCGVFFCAILAQYLMIVARGKT